MTRRARTLPPSPSYRSVTPVFRDDRLLAMISRMADVPSPIDDVQEGLRAAGYGEYRAHLAYMDFAAAQYSFNDAALLRLSETIKDALDPAGILAPGKQGIWPRVWRGKRGYT